MRLLAFPFTIVYVWTGLKTLKASKRRLGFTRERPSQSSLDDSGLHVPVHVPVNGVPLL